VTNASKRKNPAETPLKPTASPSLLSIKLNEFVTVNNQRKVKIILSHDAHGSSICIKNSGELKLNLNSEIYQHGDSKDLANQFLCDGKMIR